jgi:flagellar operon protein
MTQVNPALIPPGVGGASGVATGASAGTVSGTAFSELLGARAAQVHFSGHAIERLRRRGIAVDPQTLARLEGGVDRAAGKGSRESVVFVDDKAFVVSVRNRTVITAVDSAHMREHVFTNIDSAVIA